MQRKIRSFEIKGKEIKDKKKKKCISSAKTYFLMTYLFPTKAYPIIQKILVYQYFLWDEGNCVRVSFPKSR